MGPANDPDDDSGAIDDEAAGVGGEPRSQERPATTAASPQPEQWGLPIQPGYMPPFQHSGPPPTADERHVGVSGIIRATQSKKSPFFFAAIFAGLAALLLTMVVIVSARHPSSAHMTDAEARAAMGDWYASNGHFLRLIDADTESFSDTDGAKAQERACAQLGRDVQSAQKAPAMPVKDVDSRWQEWLSLWAKGMKLCVEGKAKDDTQKIVDSAITVIEAGQARDRLGEVLNAYVPDP